MWVEFDILLEDRDGFGEGSRPAIEHLLEAIAEREAAEDVFVDLSSLFVAEAVVVGREVVSCISALAVKWWREARYNYCLPV